MGTYINTGDAGFESSRSGKYIDKSELMAVVNSTLNSKRRFSCVTRGRRFGKSMTAEMFSMTTFATRYHDDGIFR